MTREQQTHHHGMVLSYQNMRQGLGYIGLALPVVLLLGGLLSGSGIEASISHYYYTAYSDVFVGALCAIGLFLIGSYGPDSVAFGFLSHKNITRLGGLGAIGLAFVPTHTDKMVECSFVQCVMGVQRGSDLHHVFAALFFINMALSCLLLFSERVDSAADPERQRQRNRLYVGSGVIILMAMGALYTYRISPDHVKAIMDANSYQFWIESIGVWLFGACWLVKGNAIPALRDREFIPDAVNLDCAPSRPRISLAYARSMQKLPEPVYVGIAMPEMQESTRHRA